MNSNSISHQIWNDEQSFSSGITQRTQRMSPEGKNSTAATGEFSEKRKKTLQTTTSSNFGPKVPRKLNNGGKKQIESGLQQGGTLDSIIKIRHQIRDQQNKCLPSRGDYDVQSPLLKPILNVPGFDSDSDDEIWESSNRCSASGSFCKKKVEKEAIISTNRIMDLEAVPNSGLSFKNYNKIVQMRWFDHNPSPSKKSTGKEYDSISTASGDRNNIQPVFKFEARKASSPK